MRRFKHYDEGWMKELQDPAFASEYLSQALATEDQGTFLLALRDVVESQGGLGPLARQLSIQRQSLYRVLSMSGNPVLTTLREILEKLGLVIFVAPKPKAPRRRKKR